MTIQRMSAMDAGFLDVETDVTQMHIGAVLILEGPPPPLTKLREMVASKLPLVPRYRQVVQPVALELGRPMWVDDPHFDIDYHLRPARVPEPGDNAQMEDLVGYLMGRTLDRNRPLWEMWRIEGLQDDRWAVVAKVHHCMADGVSGAELLSLILDPSPDAEPMPASLWEPEPAPNLADSLLQSLGQATDTGRGMVRAMWGLATRPARVLGPVRDLSRAFTVVTRTAKPMVASSLNGPIGPNRRWAGTSVPVADVKKVRSTLGGAFNDVILAAVTRGFRDLLDYRGEPVDHPIRTLVPVSVRERDERGRAIGDGTLANKVAAIFAELPVDTEDPVERLAMISRQMDEAKETNQAEVAAWFTDLAAFVPRAVSSLGLRLFSRAAQRNVTTITTNIPGPQFPLYAAGCRMLHAYPYVPIGMQVRMGVAILSYDGEVNFGITGDYDNAPDVDVMAAGIDAGMQELIDVAGMGSAPTYSLSSV